MIITPSMTSIRKGHADIARQRMEKTMDTIWDSYTMLRDDL
jgi:hypothetical protein